jgi:hypothetical protein
MVYHCLLISPAGFQGVLIAYPHIFLIFSHGVFGEIIQYINLKDGFDPEGVLQISCIRDDLIL